MFPRLARDRIAPMRITISLDGTDPPSGGAASDDGAPVLFTGWLGLLKALSELLSPAEARAEPLPRPAEPERTPPAS